MSTPPPASRLSPLDVATQERLPPVEAAAREDELRGRLGLLPLAFQWPGRIRLMGWILTIAIGALAGCVRLWHLAFPHQLIFDETYYVKGATSLLQQGFEGKWASDANSAFSHGDFSALSHSEADYVVHPPVGKWLLALGQWIFGADSSFGWRISAALIGIASVMITVRLILRLFRSPWLALLGGTAMSLDGLGIVMSRSGLLDNFLAFFVILGFWAIVRDREDARGKLAHAAAFSTYRDDPLGSRMWSRPWLVAAGIFLGLGCAVKWSAIYAVAVWGIMVFAWGASARKIVGVPQWFKAGILREGVPAFFSFVPTAAIAYLVGWASWFINPHSWGRGWAAAARAVGNPVPLPWAPNIVNDFVRYHMDMYTFHTGLSTPHTYQSQAWTWLVQGRPVSFYWKGTDDPAMKGACHAFTSSSGCVAEISSMGNVVVWWLALLALAGVVYGAIRLRDWRAWAILAGYAALWAPWLLYTHRTIFQFYSVVYLPFVAFALVYGTALWTHSLVPAHMEHPRIEPPRTEPAGTGLAEPESTERTGTPLNPWDQQNSRLDSHDSALSAIHGSGLKPEHGSQLSPEIEPVLHSTGWFEPHSTRLLIITVIAIIVGLSAFAIYWWPLWTGTPLPYSTWQSHMWFASWI
ncbi:MAG: phospholipid carrier-dependent glycosyltransferase [Actinomycetaceae bacterium]|nr:phospholipid carrier-dependent glycosyltransferase [Actinomycetaceae bacterium]MDY6083532.1 phospholipid carrier-dependent glycosyltransferase [Actinomycetaceae bacterium]